MKISHINFYTNNLPLYKKKSSLNVEDIKFDYHKTNHPQEVIGRSIVSFGETKLSQKEIDRILLKNLVDILRFKEECDVEVLNSIYEKFLKEKKINNLSEIAGDEFLSEQTDFLSDVVDGCCLDNHETILVATEISNRLVHPAKYEKKKVDIFSKDFAAFASTSQKYKMKNMDVKVVYEVLSTIAKESNLESIFDIFNKDKNPRINKDLELVQKYSEIEDFENFAIDMGVMAKMSEYQRNIEIDCNGQWNSFLKNFKNNILASYICLKFNIEKHFADILEVLDNRAAVELGEDSNEHAGNAEIAYLIMDKCNLNLTAFKNIKEILDNSNKDLHQLIEIAAIGELVDNNYYNQ